MNNSLGYYGFKIQYILRKFIKLFHKARSINIVIILILLLVLSLLIYNVNSRIYSEDYKIKTIRYTKTSISQYSDPEIYSYISTLYSWKYYSDISLFWDNRDYNVIVKNQYPFVDKIKINWFASNVLLIDVEFNKPLLRFLYKDMIYGAYTNNLLPLSGSDGLNTWVPLILLPIYLKDLSVSISWLLYDIDVSKMLYDFLLLKTFPISGSITYIPWWNKYILRNNDLRIYFNAKKDINSQLWILSTLMTEYRWFDKLKQIDIGSLDNPIVK